MDIILVIISLAILVALIIVIYKLNTKKEVSLKDFSDSTSAPIIHAVNYLSDKIQQLEKERSTSEGILFEQLKNLKESNSTLYSVTNNLNKVLTSSQSQGILGETHLKNLLESSGLTEGVDFHTKLNTADGNIPDFVIELPGGRQLIIDCKTPTKALLEYIESTDQPNKDEKLKKLITHIKNHIKDLSEKRYNEDLSNSTDYMILYLPSDSILITALKENPDIINYASNKNIILSSPTTIMTCIKNIDMLWRQERLSKNVQEVLLLGTDLYETFASMVDSYNNIGKSITKTIEEYNRNLKLINIHNDKIKKLVDYGCSGTTNIPETIEVSKKIKTN